MRARVPAVLGVLGVSLAVGVGLAPAAVSGVHAPTHAQRSALLRALVKQDGSTSGVKAVYVANADHRLAAVCRSTPDAGRVAFLFRASGRSWRYVLSSASANASSPPEATLERACLR
jgi:hypothetical protein